MSRKVTSVEYTMPYGDDDDDIDLEIYCGMRGKDLDQWIDRVPDVSDMTAMMSQLLVFLVIARRQKQYEEDVSVTETPPKHDEKH
jgi:predicted membrane chloride channel (bestrophin family)